MAAPVPVYSDISLTQLYEDPYPVYARLRHEAPIAYISEARINLVTRYDLIRYIDTHANEFPAYDPESLQLKAMGHTMMRKDGRDHRAERMIVQKSVTPALVREYWKPRFQWIVDDLIANLQQRQAADLFTDFAEAMASRCLMELLGLINVRWQDLCQWSQALMDATSNYAGDPAIWAKQQQASQAIDDALDEIIAIRRINPDPSFISMLANEDGIGLDQIRANVKVIIGGGINEPRDATCTALYCLLSNPDQLQQVLDDPSPEMFSRVFEESVRFCAPIGMYPRRVGRDMEYAGVQLKQNDLLGLCVGAACHDEDYWENPGSFSIDRPQGQRHLAFGVGAHICLGFQVARMQVGQLAVPSLLRQLPGLRLDDEKPCRFGGWVFRGPLSLPVRWNNEGR